MKRASRPDQGCAEQGVFRSICWSYFTFGGWDASQGAQEGVLEEAEGLKAGLLGRMLAASLRWAMREANKPLLGTTWMLSGQQAWRRSTGEVGQCQK